MLLELIKFVFTSPSDGRLRVGWRLLIQAGLMMGILSCAIIPFVLSGGLTLTGEGLLYLQLVEFLGVTISVWLSRRFLDRRSFSSLGLNLGPRFLQDVGTGIGIAFLMVSLVTLFLYASGWLQITGFAWQEDPVQMVLGQTLVVLLAFILVGWNEELLSRGYHLQNLAGSMRIHWAVVLSSVVFGGLHLTNPNATLAGAAGVFLAGVFLAYAYLRSGRLWLPIGLHTGWNLFEGLVFGFPVSGLEPYHLIRVVVDGPERWTGGDFGPEAGLVALPGLLLGVVLVWVYTRDLGNSYLSETPDQECGPATPVLNSTHHD